MVNPDVGNVGCASAAGSSERAAATQNSLFDDSIVGLPINHAFLVSSALSPTMRSSSEISFEGGSLLSSRGCPVSQNLMHLVVSHCIKHMDCMGFVRASAVMHSVG